MLFGNSTSKTMVVQLPRANDVHDLNLEFSDLPGYPGSSVFCTSIGADGGATIERGDAHIWNLE